MKTYRDWQKDLFNKWSQVGYWGICQARTGAGDKNYLKSKNDIDYADRYCKTESMLSSQHISA